MSPERLAQLRKIFDRATIVLLVWTCLVGVGAFVALPGKIATKFDAGGHPIAYGGKGSLLIEPIMALVIFFLIDWISKRPVDEMNLPVKITPANRWTMQRLVLTFLSYTKVCVVALFAWIAWVAVSSAAGYLPSAFLLVSWFIGLALIAGLVFFIRESRKTTE